MTNKKGFRQPKQPTKKHREKKWKEAIFMLNDTSKIKVGPSQIHGVGVFALRDIAKDELLYADMIPNAFDIPFEMFDQINDEVRDIILGQYPQIVNGSHFLYPSTRMLTYLNHSDNPNYDAKTDKALRDIKKGEEITEDYKQIDNYKKVFKWL